MIKVYLASPYTNGDVAANVHRQIKAANELMDRNFAPFTPLLYHFHHLVIQRPYDDWLELDLIWLEQCDCMLRLPSLEESSGADTEEAVAKSLGLPIFDNIDKLDFYFHNKE